MVDHEISFIFTPPTFGNKNELCSLNNISRWYRFAKTKIKDEFKNQLKEWSLPVWEDNPFMKAELEYTILRTNRKKMDSDALSLTYKWVQDLLVEEGYLTDDDHTKVILNPTQLNVEGSVETSVLVEIKLYERYEMTIESLKIMIASIAENLENVGTNGSGEDVHVKAASARVRKALGEIKNATPQLRRDLVELDKKK